MLGCLVNQEKDTALSLRIVYAFSVAANKEHTTQHLT